MEKIASIDVPFDQKTLDVVLRTLTYIHDNYDTPGALDKTQMGVSFEEIQEILQKLRSYQNSEHRKPFLVMNSDEWCTYYVLLGYAAIDLRNQDPNDSEFLDELTDQYHEWEEGGQTPSPT